MNRTFLISSHFLFRLESSLHDDHKRKNSFLIEMHFIQFKELEMVFFLWCTSCINHFRNSHLLLMFSHIFGHHFNWFGLLFKIAGGIISLSLFPKEAFNGCVCIPFRNCLLRSLQAVHYSNRPSLQIHCQWMCVCVSVLWSGCKLFQTKCNSINSKMNFISFSLFAMWTIINLIFIFSMPNL